MIGRRRSAARPGIAGRRAGEDSCDGPEIEMSRIDQRRRAGLAVAVLAAGGSGLTWEVLWQHHTGLALGVSAYGTAVTLAAMMAGLGCGGLLAARLACRGAFRRPLFAYGLAELAVGAGGLCVPLGLSVLATLDTAVYAASPTVAGLLHLLGMVLLLLLPATAMGATLPILAPYAERVGLSIAALYAANLLGAVAGVLVSTFLLIPWLGIFQSALVAAGVNLGVAWWAVSRRAAGATQPPEPRRAWPPLRALVLAATSGCVVFALEVAWFRSLRAALQSTTESFALILASFLLALAAGGWLAARLRPRAPGALAWVLPAAGLAILCATPAIDGFDRWTAQLGGSGWTPVAFSFAAALVRLGWLLLPVAVPVTLLGMIFPWLLAEHATTAGTGRLYAVNTLGAVAGALAAGFVLLPWIGAARTSWLAALAVLAVSAASCRGRQLAAHAAVAAAGLGIAAGLGGGSARTRIQGVRSDVYEEILYVAEGPDSTVWVGRAGEEHDNALDLVIDGFAASGEAPGASYMVWMGHLPALAVPGELGEALVICFGTGQTADAVRRHRPEALWVVDVSRAVMSAAPLFGSNHGVLEDPKVRPVVMDGRAFLRRAGERRFDLVTLEPMPPNFAGSNSLYSREFYELIRRRLTPRGVAAQWVPFHLVAPEHMQAIVATFSAVFPHSRLWIDPASGTGILVGAEHPWQLHPSRAPLPWPQAVVAEHFELGRDAVAALAEGGTPITDDNQLLAYGPARFSRARGSSWHSVLGQQNLAIVRWFRDQQEAEAR